MSVDFDETLQTVTDESPLVNAVTNTVTVNDVAQIILHWGGLPVMSDDGREVGDMVSASDACLLNMGTVSEAGEATMMAAGQAANEAGVPVVLDPVGVGSTPTRDRVADRLASELNIAAIKGNYGEITQLAGDNASVRGVESVGEYSDISTTTVACAQKHNTVVVASGEVDIVATPETAYEVSAGHPRMGTVVGTGCMLGGSIATFTGAIEDTERAALAGTAAFGLAGEAAAAGEFGDVHGPGSYNVAFKDAVASLRTTDHGAIESRIEQVLDAGE